MYPNNNAKAYSKENSSIFSAFPDDYLFYIEQRLTNRLMLLNNPVLIEQIGVDVRELLVETQKLIEISNYIKIPNVVEEKQKPNGLFR